MYSWKTKDVLTDSRLFFRAGSCEEKDRTAGSAAVDD